MKNTHQPAQTINPGQYTIYMGSFKAGNFPKECVNEAASQISKLSTALNQYKEDAQEGEFINNLMAADLMAMRDKYTRFAEISKCTTVHLLCSLIVIDIDKALKNQNFDLNQLIK